MSLSQRALEALEWNTVCTALAGHTRSEPGKELALKHRPFATAAESQWLRNRVLEAQVLLSRSPVHGYLSGTSNPAALLERASRDGVLLPGELWICGHFMGTLGMVAEELRSRQLEAPLLASDFAKAPGTPPVCARINQSVTAGGEILDSASPELARLRSERAHRRVDFERALNQKVKEWNGEGLLQDNYYDVMDGRYVVPVKAEQQSKLSGVLFGRSNTGQSVFIEPAELTAPNNALKELELAVRAEEHRILRKLSREVGNLTDSFLPWVEPVAELDLTLAAAALSNDWGLQCPAGPEPRAELRLNQVFHPGLIVRDPTRSAVIVRNSYSLPAATASDGGFALLISGPNTGGKTVLLKATGLAACMANAGLLVPADRGSVFPHYASILAFIGDEQDLAAGLSSFSAQILEMKAVLEQKGQPFLIVIDEILSSTDPEEASALAQALIEELVARGHHVLVTSHFSELSLRCRQLPRVAVAAMEFDNGKPTYRLRPDELGSSHALETAERLGLSPRLIERARSLMSTAKLDYEKAVEALKVREQQLEAERAAEHQAFENEKVSIRKEFEEKLANFLSQARATLDETVNALTQRIQTYVRQGIGGSRPSNFGSKTGEKLEAKAREAMAGLEQAVARETGAAAAPAEKEVAVGAVVKVRSMRGTKGTVLELRDGSGKPVATLQIGNFRMERPVEDLEVLEAPKSLAAIAASRSASYYGGDVAERVAGKLDLRGKRYDEALAEAERYIDQAFRSGAMSVTVVTGHGTGALKKGLRELLSGLPYVREFHPERQNDDGATVIEFDR